MLKIKHLFVLCAALMLSFSACAAHATKTAKVVKAKTATVKVLVNINKADIKTLRTVKGIGPKRAAAIISYRKKHGAFKNTCDLNKLKGKGYGFSKKYIKSITKKITV